MNRKAGPGSSSVSTGAQHRRTLTGFGPTPNGPIFRIEGGAQKLAAAIEVHQAFAHSRTVMISRPKDMVMSQPRSGRRILVVEGEAAVVMLLDAML